MRKHYGIYSWLVAGTLAVVSLGWSSASDALEPAADPDPIAMFVGR